MKTEFKDFQDIIVNIGKIILRNTDIEKKCQYCGKPAQIRYNIKDPYMIQLICKECKIKKKLYNSKDMCDDIPLIDIKAHITTKNIRLQLDGLTKEVEDGIKKLLKSKKGKMESLKDLNITLGIYDRWVEFYKEKDPNIEDKLKKHFKKNVDRIIVTRTLKDNVLINSNNLSKIKYERHITNKMIIKKTNNGINNASLSLICRGKIEPKIKTKCMLAEALGLSVADIFPKDYLFKDIHNYSEYLVFYNNIKSRLIKLILDKYKNKENYIFVNIAKEINVNESFLYDYVKRNGHFKHDNLVRLLNYLDKQ